MTAMTLYRKRCYTHVLGFLLHLGFGDTAVHKVTFDAVVRALLARELVHCCDTSRRKHRRKCAAAAAGVATGEVPMRQPEAASTLSADIVPLEGPVTAEDSQKTGTGLGSMSVLLLFEGLCMECTYVNVFD